MMLTKNEFLKQLKMNLKRAHIVGFKQYMQDYEELISDEAEARSVSENKIVQSLDDPKQIVKNILTEDQPKTHMATGLLILIVVALVLGSPLWCSLLLLALAMVLLGYALVWLVPAGLTFGMLLALVLGAYGIPAAIIALFKVGAGIGFSEFGFSLLALGCCLILAKLTWWSIKYFSIVSAMFYKWLVGQFHR